MVLLEHAVVYNMELIIEHDITIDLFDNVVFHEDQTVDLDVYCEPVCVETRANFLVYLDEDVIRWFLNRPLAVFL